jgi:RNA polymerase sigma-70 factor, ECF subfamily
MFQGYHSTKEKNVRKNFDADLFFQHVVKHDDYKAFERLFHHYYNNLCKYALKLVNVEMVAEELVSDVFLKMWNNRNRIDIQTSFQSYIFRSVHNQALDYLRSQYARQAQKFEDIDYKCTMTSDNPEQVMILRETDDKIEKAIEKLAPQARLIFRMSRDQGLKYREIADALNLSIKTIETQMGRALKQLRSAVS